MIDEILSAPLLDLCDPDKILARQLLSRLVELKGAVKELLELRKVLSAVHDIVALDGSEMLLERLRSLIKSEQALKETAESLATLLKLDDERPADTTWWRRHWNEAKQRAVAALGSLPVDLGVKGAGGMFRCKEHGGYGFRSDCGICGASVPDIAMLVCTCGANACCAGLSGPPPHAAHCALSRQPIGGQGVVTAHYRGFAVPPPEPEAVAKQEARYQAHEDARIGDTVERGNPEIGTTRTRVVGIEGRWISLAGMKGTYDPSSWRLVSRDATEERVRKAREEGVEAVRRAWKRDGWPSGLAFPIVYPHDFETTNKGK